MLRALPPLRQLTIELIDPMALGGAIMSFLTCVTGALLVPVRRATKVDPLVALRSE